MRKYVIDASIVLTALLESRKEILDKIKDFLLLVEKGKIEAISTPFLKIEVANGLRFNVNNSTKAVELFDGFLALPLKYQKLDNSLYEESMYISYKIETTIYDTLYHVLAKAQNATFLTCDENYYKKAKNLGDIELLQ